MDVYDPNIEIINVMICFQNTDEFLFIEFVSGNIKTGL